MKTLTIIAALFLTSQAFAQNVTMPDKEFATKLSKEMIEVKGTGTENLEMMILKSKGYRNGKVQMGVFSTLPEGLTITFSPERGNFEVSQITLTTSGVSPGEYSLILGATVYFKQKGSVLKIIVQ